MKPRASAMFLLLSLLGASLAACGGGGVTVPAATCGPPPPVPVPILALSFPEPNATNVPDSIGILLFAGETFDFFGPTSVTLMSAAGTSVPVGAYTAPPSPLPSPYAVPSGFSGNSIPFVAAPIPTLSPSTAYNVTYNYTDYGDTPPSCRSAQSLPIGSFTTQ